MHNLSSVMVDANGYSTIVLIHQQAGGTSILFAVRAASVADWRSYWEGAVTTQVPAPGAGPYRSGQDRAVFTFVCADSTLTTVIVPAPLASIFLADGETVDPAALPAANLIAAVVAGGCNAAGSPVVSYVSGVRLRRPRAPLGG